MSSKLLRAWGVLWVVGVAVGLNQWAVSAGASGFPADALALPIGLTLAYVGARIAKGGPLLASHGQALATFGDAVQGLFSSRVETAFAGVQGVVSSRVTGAQVQITLQPDPPLDPSILLQPGVQQPELIGRTPLFPPGVDLMLRGQVRGDAVALAHAMDQPFREELDDDLKTYRLSISGGAIRTAVPMSWKADRIRLAVERMFEVVAHLTPSAADAKARLLSISRDDPEPAVRVAAAGQLFTHHPQLPETVQLREELLGSRNPDAVLVAASVPSAKATRALVQLVEEGRARVAKAAHERLLFSQKAPDEAREAWGRRLRSGSGRWAPGDALPDPIGRWLAQAGDVDTLATLRTFADDLAQPSSDRRTAIAVADQLRARLEEDGAGGGLAMADGPGGLAVTGDGELALEEPPRRPKQKA